MKLPTTIKMGTVFIENVETGEEIAIGRMPTLKVVIGEPEAERAHNPTMIQVSLRYTWWSRVKMRLFIWRTGFVARYYYRKLAK